MLIKQAKETLLGKETIGGSNFQRLHIGHRPWPLAGCCNHAGLILVYTQTNYLVILVSRFRGNDEKGIKRTFYESINVGVGIYGFFKVFGF